jgi:hypothetical protein
MKSPPAFSPSLPETVIREGGIATEELGSGIYLFIRTAPVL